MKKSQKCSEKQFFRATPRKIIGFSNFKCVFLETMFLQSARSRTRRFFIRLTWNFNCSFFIWLSSEVHTILTIYKQEKKKQYKSIFFVEDVIFCLNNRHFAK